MVAVDGLVLLVTVIALTFDVAVMPVKACIMILLLESYTISFQEEDVMAPSGFWKVPTVYKWVSNQ